MLIMARVSKAYAGTTEGINRACMCVTGQTTMSVTDGQRSSAATHETPSGRSGWWWLDITQ